MAKKIREKSAAGVERANRRQAVMREKMLALADYEVQAISIRKNMVRLRALREAKEVADQALQAETPIAPTTKPKKSKSAAGAQGAPKPRAG